MPTIDQLKKQYVERFMIDATPDDDYPLRILRAYIDETMVSDNCLGLPPESPVLAAMNEATAKRNEILRRAIEILKEADHAQS